VLAYQNGVDVPGWKLSRWSNNTDCMVGGLKTWVVFDCYSFFCMSLYMLHGAMTASHHVFNV